MARSPRASLGPLFRVPPGVRGALRPLGEAPAMTLLRCGRLACAACLALVACSLATGCGAGRGTVSRRVLVGGQPLPGGWLTFRPADPRQNTVTVPIEADGRFTARLPAGEVQISIDNRELEPIEPDEMPT